MKKTDLDYLDKLAYLMEIAVRATEGESVPITKLTATEITSRLRSIVFEETHQKAFYTNTIKLDL